MRSPLIGTRALTDPTSPLVRTARLPPLSTSVRHHRQLPPVRFLTSLTMFVLCLREPSAEPSSRGETIASCLKMRLPFGPSPQRYPVRLRGSRGSGQRGVGRTLTINNSIHTPHTTTIRHRSAYNRIHTAHYTDTDRLAHATPACGMEQTIIGTGKAYSRRD